ncbi:TetR family transcriptional regulator [Specibacter sp. RAF43]|uniref:TetR family transcriptional regulator n=1 Tax=Specibacter sp. RAF43 TaxID=3233057 RepID=UPI003F964841
MRITIKHTEGAAAMTLTREHVVDAAMTILREYGLADLSMRRLARDLGVQPGALYWHVKNKQDLLTVLSGRILAPVAEAEATTVREVAVHIRAALLGVRDGAEVVALAHALAPETPTPLRRLAPLLADQGLTSRHAGWAASTLVHYILGSVTEEQTRAGLIRAGLLDAGESEATAAFGFGLDLFLAGLAGAAGAAG